MWASLIILTALIVVGALLYAHHIYTGRREADREADAPRTRQQPARRRMKRKSAAECT